MVLSHKRNENGELLSLEVEVRGEKFLVTPIVRGEFVRMRKKLLKDGTAWTDDYDPDLELCKAHVKSPEIKNWEDLPLGMIDELSAKIFEVSGLAVSADPKQRLMTVGGRN